MFEPPTAVVAVVDDDAGMLQAMCRVLETEGFVTEAFGTAEDFLASGAAARAQCLVLDVQLPGASGPELQRRLHTLGRWIPSVFVTGREPRPAGRCLLKPFPADSLVRAVHESMTTEAWLRSP